MRCAEAYPTRIWWGEPHPTKLLCCKLWPIGSVLVGEDSSVVAVVVADPGHVEGKFVFVTAFGDEVEERVGGDEGVEAAAVGGIGVEHFAVGVFVEDAGAGGFVA